MACEALIVGTCCESLWLRELAITIDKNNEIDITITIRRHERDELYILV